jgi:hypothetical protein
LMNKTHQLHPVLRTSHPAPNIALRTPHHFHVRRNYAMKGTERM